MRWILLIIMALVVLSACENGVVVDTTVTDEEEGTELSGPYSCETDTDCVVKNVQNCCGYYPRCVNVDHEPDIEAVKAQCAKERQVSICGFPDITDCGCVANTCKSFQDGKEV